MSTYRIAIRTLVATLLLQVAACTAAPFAYAQKPALPPVPAGEARILAITSWDCQYTKPAIFYAADAFYGPNYGELGAHEGKHVAQALGVGNCRLWHALNQDAEFRTRIESQAFCAMAYYDLEHYDATEAQVLARIAKWMLAVPGVLDYSDAWGRLQEFYQKGPNC